MAKVTITFEDTDSGNVKVVSDPSFEKMMSMQTSGHEWTSAQGLAMFALNTIWREGKKKSPANLILPSLGR